VDWRDCKLPPAGKLRLGVPLPRQHFLVGESERGVLLLSREAVAESVVGCRLSASITSRPIAGRCAARLGDPGASQTPAALSPCSVEGGTHARRGIRSASKLIESRDMAQMPLESVGRPRDGGVSVAQLDGLGAGPSIGTADGQSTQSTPLDSAQSGSSVR
jgi:hypothetical protein